MISTFVFFLKLIFLKKYKYVFYSESIYYQNNFLPLIKKIIFNENINNILYLSSDKNDFISHKYVKNFFLKNRYERFLAFYLIKANFFFLTVVNINNNELKKTRLIDNYIYVFHSIKSCHKDLPHNSFDHYDYILCCGDHHVKEIRELEFLNKTKKKKLLKVGYLYFEFCKKIISKDVKKFDNSILLAFSWSYNESFFDRYLINLIDSLLLTEKVILRPHPEHFKRSSETIKKIQEKFKNNINFTFDTNQSNIESMCKSKLLITDNSGISSEFILLLKRPVIYFDNYNRIQNIEFDKFKSEVFEDKIKVKFGKALKYDESINIKNLIDETFCEFELKKKNIDLFINDNLYNFNSYPSDQIYKILNKINSN